MRFALALAIVVGAGCYGTLESGTLEGTDEPGTDATVPASEPLAGCAMACHGTQTSNAPPRDLAGNTDKTAPGVGAHQAHLQPSAWRQAMACTSCHLVPASVDAPGHLDGDNVAEIRFDGMNPTGAHAAGSCSTMYCHGNGRGENGTIAWLAPGPLACTGCHATNGTGMSGDHLRHIGQENMQCSECHGAVVNANMGIVGANLHVNGVNEVRMAQGTYDPATRQCSATGCHGVETW
ncbi:MAG: CxxxxCH/CxxCH domain c-type cytochrome [Kofleriaceae bacterium]